MNNIFLTSDTHFFHRNILQYCNRPFSTVEEMNDALIKNWNTVVKPNDIVYHLGDLTLSTRVELVDEILGRLNGTIRLVKGNHDKWLKKYNLLENKDKIEWIRPYNKETLGGHEIIMCHFPFLTWDGSYRGSIHCHGHAHGGNDHLNVGTKRIDVGVDAVGMKLFPIHLDDVIKYTQDGKNIDHHDL